MQRQILFLLRFLLVVVGKWIPVGAIANINPLASMYVMSLLSWIEANLITTWLLSRGGYFKCWCGISFLIFFSGFKRFCPFLLLGACRLELNPFPPNPVVSLCSWFSLVEIWCGASPWETDFFREISYKFAKKLEKNQLKNEVIYYLKHAWRFKHTALKL